MADKKISELTNITGANLADGDELVVVDASESETKAITFGEFKTALDTSTGFVRITGDAMTGDLSFGDNDKAIFGAGSDLEIYYDSASGDSIIAESGSGHLKLLGNDIRINNADSSKAYFKATNGGSAIVYYDNAPKLSTTSTGVDITGTLTSDGLTVDGVETPTLTLTDLSTSNQLKAKADNTGGWFGTFTDDPLRLYTNNTQRVRVENNGDISFYEDTGTTAKFFWDASAERLGIGTSSPSAPLEVDGGSDIAFFDGTNVRLKIQNPSTGVLQLNSSGAGDSLSFATVDTEAMRIDSSGNVGIGTSSPTEELHIYKNTTNSVDLKIENSEGSATLKANNSSFYVDADNHVFRSEASSEYMRIDSSGNVGIGTSNIGARITLGDASSTDSTNMIRSYRGGGTSTYAEFGEGSGGAKLEHVGGGPVYFKTDGSERMRIDSSGNVGIGTSSPVNVSGVPDLTVAGKFFTSDGTATNPAHSFTGDQNTGIFRPTTDTVGITTGGSEVARFDSSGNLMIGGTNGNPIGNHVSQIIANGANGLGVHRDGGTPFKAGTDDNRNIIEAYKQGVLVGGLGVQSTGFYIDGETGHAGIRFAGNEVSPRNSGSDADGTVSLGESDKRFKDLYLSGGVFLGGTGASNHLDDYEEGTWTPSLGGTATYNFQSGFYTKVGRQVTLVFYMDVSSIGTGSTSTITGVPFSSTTFAPASGAISRFTGTAASYVSAFGQIDSSSITIVGKTSASTSTASLSPFQNGTSIYMTITYFTS